MQLAGSGVTPGVVVEEEKVTVLKPGEGCAAKGSRCVWVAFSSRKLLVRGDSFKFDSRLVMGSTAVLKPGSEILALTDIEDLELMTALRNSLDTYSSHSNTATD